MVNSVAIKAARIWYKIKEAEKLRETYKQWRNMKNIFRRKEKCKVLISTKKRAED